MKKTYTVLFFVLFSYVSFAQVRITDLQTTYSGYKRTVGSFPDLVSIQRPMDSLDRKISLFGLLLTDQLDETVHSALLGTEEVLSENVYVVSDKQFKDVLMNVKIPDSLKKKFVLLDIRDITYVGAFFMVSDSSIKTELQALGGKISYTSKGILTGYIPVYEIRNVLKIPGVMYVETAIPVSKRLDEARIMTRVNEVNSGVQLSQAYTGKGVMIGVIDGGFDLGHPAFYDSLGKYRVAAYWNQNDQTGSGPDPFGYGSEFVNKQDILDEQTDNPKESHGTHVAGITSGANWSTTQKFKGVAYNSLLTLVSPAQDENNIHLFNAALYVLNKGIEADMPTVVNLSLGSHIGPHDGTSLFDQTCDLLVENGESNSFSIVGAAGNEGDESLHISKAFTSLDTSVSSFIRFESKSCGTPCLGVNGEGKIDIWGEPGKNLGIRIGIFDKKSGSYYYLSPYFSTATEISQIQKWSNGEIFFSLKTRVKEPLNNKPHIFIELNSYPINNNDYQVIITVSGKNTVFHAWANHEYYVKFSDEGLGNSGLMTGNSDFSIGEIGGTGKNIITVGSYQTAQTNDIGNRSSFSSYGPTIDNRMKPEVTAPGEFVASSVNSYDNSFKPGQKKIAGVFDFRGRQYLYAYDAGTSMSSPIVAGIIALWKEASPFLTTNNIKEVLRSTSIRDRFTGNAPNNFWGYGKIDAYAGIKYILLKMPTKPILSFNDSMICSGQRIILAAPAGFASYSWSTGDTTRYITVDEEGDYRVSVKNASGWWSRLSEPTSVYVDSVEAKIGRFKPESCLNSIYLKTTIGSGQSVRWYRNDTLINGAITAQFIPQQSGTYKVRLQNDDSKCFNVSDTLIVDMSAYTNRLFKIDTIKSCSTDSIELDAGSGFKKYIWSTGAASQKIKVARSGKYSVTVNCGEDISNFGYLLFPQNSPNSTRSFLNIPDAAQLDFREQMSILMTLNVGAINGRPTILNKGNDASYQVVINWPMLTFTYPGMDKAGGLKVQIPQYSWFSIAIVKTKDSVFLYYNGNIVDRGPGKNPIPTNNESVVIGKRSGVDFDYFVGGVDQLSFWNRGLSEAEVRNYINCTSGTSPGCVGFYNFDPSENDQTPYVNNGSFYNSGVGGCCGGRYGTTPFTICSGASSTTDSVYVQIEPLPQGVTKLNWDKSCVEQSITFRNESDSSKRYLINWSWDMGDGNRYATASVSHIYRQTGTFNVRLRMTSPSCIGFRDSLVKQIIISAPMKSERYLPVDVRKNTEKQVQARAIGQKYRWLPGSSVTDSLKISTRVKVSKETDFRILITDASGCNVVDSQLVRVFDRYTVFVPSGFSPDGNGINDVLRPILVGIKEVKSFRIYSRWGNLVYSSNTINGWDGTYNGMPLPPDTYTWVFEGVDEEGIAILMSGKTTLIR